MRAALAASALFVPAYSLIYKIDNEFNLTSHASYSEGWMYGSNDGPKGAPQGESYVDVDFEVTAIPLRKPNADVNVNVMFYRSNVLDFGIENNLNICPETLHPPSSFLDVERSSFPATASGQGSDQTYTAKVTAHREVSESGLLHVFVQVCPADMGTSALKIDGDLTFRNPYGYLPGMDFGCLPFELFRFLASIALGVLFSSAMLRHRATLLPVHKMIFGVVVLGTVESLSWLAAYSYMNSTGKPYCCPYPGTVILAMIMEVLRRTTSRFMLLMICLGYGITRVQLEKREMISVVTLTVIFLVSGFVQLASSVASASRVRNGERYGNYDSMLAVPALLTDMVFLMWIYGTLANMIKELRELNETYKLQMFKSLAWTLGTFVTLFTVLTVAMLAAEGSQEQSWQWKWEWVQVVSWEILNFCMLVAVSIIWRPSERSAMLAYSKQLAMTEGDAEDADGIELEAVEMQGPGTGHFTIGENDDDDHDDDHDEDTPTRRKVQHAEGKADDRHGPSARGTAYAMDNFQPQQHTDLT